MCRVMEEMRNETEMQTKINTVLRLIAMNKLSLEEIASASDLSLEKVRELASGKSA